MKRATILCTALLSTALATNADAVNHKAVKACQDMANALNREYPEKIYTPIPSTAETRISTFKCNMTVITTKGEYTHVYKGVKKLEGRQFFIQESSI